VSRGPNVLRESLWPLSVPYAAVVAIRNACYERGVFRRHRLPVTVLSVGNLRVGGSGKTPLVSWLVDRARSLGRRPGVLARGYGRAPGQLLNDEGLLLASRHEDLPQVQDVDRVRGGLRLCAEFDVDLVLVDDGFQHRRLHRDRDIVCLDAARPFDRGLLLPAGDLREPPSSLRRADLVVLTRAGGLDPDQLAERRARICRVARRDLPVLVTEHRPTRLCHQPSGAERPLANLRGARVLLVSAIARPGSFRSTVEGLGANVVGEQVFRDHHVYTDREVRGCAQRASGLGASLLTTEKDAVKLRGSRAEHLVLRVDLEFLHGAPRAEELGLG
jgi:tetraacyldisaccharide 4'-kinase